MLHVKSEVFEIGFERNLENNFMSCQVIRRGG